MTKQRKPRITVAVGLLAGFLSADTAAAHAMLKSARPGVGSTVSSPPHTIEIDFSEGVVPKFSGVALSDGAGKPIRVGKPSNGSVPESLVVPIDGGLPPGVYTVTWHAVSVDTHRNQGSFRFTIAP